MINFIDLNDKKYPKNLANITNPPTKLYYKGVWDQTLFDDCLAVVGSRSGTEYGKRITKKLVSEVVSRGITIVSGFMYGIDSIAHQSSVDSGGRTIAVLPYGIESSSPSYQAKLYRQILDTGGLIISEYSGNMAPQKWTFVERNRIVAGLSKAVLVVEGARTSGTMVTADLAQKFGKKLFAVSGHLDSIVSEGVNDLIKQQKAEMVTSYKDILGVFDQKVSKKTNKRYKLTKEESQIIKILKEQPLSADEVVVKTKYPQTQVSIVLTTMALAGYICEEGGKFYVS